MRLQNEPVCNAMLAYIILCTPRANNYRLHAHNGKRRRRIPRSIVSISIYHFAHGVVRGNGNNYRSTRTRRRHQYVLTAAADHYYVFRLNNVLETITFVNQ